MITSKRARRQKLASVGFTKQEWNLFKKEVKACVEKAKANGYRVIPGVYVSKDFHGNGSCCALGALSLCESDIYPVDNGSVVYYPSRGGKQTFALSVQHFSKVLPNVGRADICLALECLEYGFEAYSGYCGANNGFEIAQRSKESGDLDVVEKHMNMRAYLIGRKLRKECSIGNGLLI
jgi:hypothetical protein